MHTFFFYAVDSYADALTSETPIDNPCQRPTPSRGLEGEEDDDAAGAARDQSGDDGATQYLRRSIYGCIVTSSKISCWGDYDAEHVHIIHLIRVNNGLNKSQIFLRLFSILPLPPQPD